MAGNVFGPKNEIKESFGSVEGMNFTGAGCLFCNSQFILAGYQPRKQKPCISGLGGKREGEEDIPQTALRETIEELFELQTVPPDWIESIQQRITPKGLLQNGEYVMVLYSFEDLEILLQILNEKQVQSELYDTFPTHLLSLLFHRKLLPYPAEVSHLTLLPLVSHPKDVPFVAPHFLKDIRLLLSQSFFG